MTCVEVISVVEDEVHKRICIAGVEGTTNVFLSYINSFNVSRPASSTINITQFKADIRSFFH